MLSCARPIRTRFRAPVSGQAAARSIFLRITPTPIRCRRVLGRQRFVPGRHSSAMSSASSCCPMTRFARPRTRSARCSNFCKVPMPRPRTWEHGTAARSNANPETLAVRVPWNKPISLLNRLHLADTPMTTETELKLTASTRSLQTLAKLPWLREISSGRAKKEKLVSVYFDTPDCKLERRHVALRIRRQSGKRTQTFKTEDGGGGALSRGEWEQPVASNRPDLDSGQGTPL